MDKGGFDETEQKILSEIMGGADGLQGSAGPNGPGTGEAAQETPPEVKQIFEEAQGSLSKAQGSLGGTQETQETVMRPAVNTPGEPEFMSIRSSQSVGGGDEEKAFGRSPDTSRGGGSIPPDEPPGKRATGKGGNGFHAFFNAHKRSLVLIVLVLAGVLALTIGVLYWRYSPTKEHMDLSKFFVLSGDKDAAVIVDGEYDPDKKGAVVEGRIDGNQNAYLELNFLKTNFDRGYTYDENNGILRYATDRELITANLDSSSYTVGKSSKDLGKTILVKDGYDVFLSLDFIKLFTDIDYVTYPSPNRIAVSTGGLKTLNASITHDTAVRKNGGVKSLILEDAVKGEGVKVLENYGKWSKVLTENGVLGFVENRRLSDATESVNAKRLPEPVYNHITSDKKICLLWHQVNTQVQNSSISNILEKAKGVNVMAPTWYVVKDNDGNLESYVSTAYVKACHNAGVKVWATVNNIDIKTDGALLLNTVSSRDTLVNNLIAAAISNDLDGINVDFEGLPAKAADGYRQFIRELSLKCEANEIVLSVDNYVPTASNAYYDRANQADYADYVVIMGYDEHWSGSKDPGSVASLPFVKKGIEDTKKDVPADRIILGMPFYTRVWQINNNGEAVTSDVLSMDNTDAWIEENKVVPIWDESLGQNVGEYKKDNLIYRCWLEDEQSLILKLQLMQENRLAGGAFWKNGQDKRSVWDIIITYMR